MAMLPKVVISGTVTQEAYQEAKEAAEAKGISLSEFVRVAVVMLLQEVRREKTTNGDGEKAA